MTPNEYSTRYMNEFIQSYLETRHSVLSSSLATHTNEYCTGYRHERVQHSLHGWDEFAACAILNSLMNVIFQNLRTHRWN